jgi:hypothetical protein
MKRRREIVSDTRKLLGQSKIQVTLLGSTLMDQGEPGLKAGCCRARKRVYLGQRRMGGTWVQCSKRPRPGKMTCHWHRHLED